jgi:hypothetical protein
MSNLLILFWGGGSVLLVIALILYYFHHQEKKKIGNHCNIPHVHVFQKLFSFSHSHE